MIQLADIPNLVIQAETDLPTRREGFRVSVVRWGGEPDKEHVVLRIGDVRGKDVLVRVHSECLTSEVLGSLKCDCAEQLDSALERIARARRGIVVYLRQEGRRIGLSNK